MAGALFIFAGIIANMHIYFRGATLFNTMVMLILLVGGLALDCAFAAASPSKASRVTAREPTAARFCKITLRSAIFCAYRRIDITLLSAIASSVDVAGVRWIRADLGGSLGGHW